MQYRELNDHVQIPMLGLGTFLMADETCEKAVSTAIQAGYRLIDTAEAYGNEAAVGEGIRQSGIPRQELFLTTKVNFRSYAHTRETVQRSLENLNTDYLDLVLLHWPFGNYYAAWKELESLCEEGKIRAIGVSNFNPDRLIDLISFHHITPAVNQIETHLYCQRHIEHRWENKYGVAHMAYAPLGQGHANTMFTEVIVQEIAAKYNKTPAQVLLRRFVQDDTIVIPKSVHTERIQENIDIFDFALTQEEMAAFQALDQKKAMIGDPENPEKVEMAMTW